MTVEDVALDLGRIINDPRLSPEERNEHVTDRLLRARLELTDEDFEKILKASLLAHQICADELARRGMAVPGNDPGQPD